jgi:hypothetical protein
LWGRPAPAKQPKATMIGMQCSHFLGILILEKFIAKHKSRTREIEHWKSKIKNVWLVVYLPLWQIGKSVGNMTFPIWWESHKTNLPKHHQPDHKFLFFPGIYFNSWDLVVKRSSSLVSVNPRHLCWKKPSHSWAAWAVRHSSEAKPHKTQDPAR